MLIIELSSENVHFKIFKMIATSGFLTAVECTKSVFGRGSAPDPAGGAHDAPPDPLVGWGGGHPLPIPHPPRRVRRLGLVACGDSSPAPSAPRSQNPLRNFFSGYGPAQCTRTNGHMLSAANNARHSITPCTAEFK